MPKTRHVFSIVTLLLVMLMSSAAWAATITGSVASSTGSGRIYVVAESTADRSRSFGTSLATAGPFTISGVIPGTYVLHAFRDTQGTGIQHANDPRGTSAQLTLGPSATTVAAGAITLAAPAPVAVRAPEATVYGGNGVNLVKWTVRADAGGPPTAERYTIEWSTSQTGSTIAGTREVRSGYDDFFLHQGAGSLYYRVTAHVRVGNNDTTANSGWIRVVPPYAATGSVTGTVSLQGATPSGPLYVAVVNEYVNPAVFRVAVVSNPGSTASYTVPMVPPGNYSVIAFFDQNNNGSYDVGDAGMLDTNDYSPLARVTTGQVTVPAIQLDGGNASAIITTGHGRSDNAEWFNLVVSAHSMRRQVVAARILSGPQLTQPVTLGLNPAGRFHTRIPMLRQIAGQTYPIEVTFSDNTTETLNEQVTAVLESFGTPTAPVNNVAFNPTPTFSWSAPSQPPADYIYTIWLTNAATGASIWNVWGLPSTFTSMRYGDEGTVTQAQLTNGVTYKWILNVTDRNGNMAAREVTFTPTGSAAINAFTPAGGAAGTAVTITGINFPANPTVRFNGTTAQVTAASGTSITAVVPASATTGSITILNGATLVATSTKSFIVGAPLNIRGVVRDNANAVVPNARVEMAEDPTRFTTTAADGSFTLQPLFRGDNVTLRITAAGHVPTYSVYFQNLTQSQNLTPYPFHLYTQAQLTGWGVTSGRGMIAGHVLNSGTEPNSPLASVTVTAAPSNTVNHLNGTTNSTAANGAFLVTNVPDLQYVTTTGARSGWTFYSSGFLVRAGSVTEGPLYGSLGGQPSIGSFTPASGKRLSTVTISGVNFSPTAAENVVEFTAGPTTWVRGTVTAATATSLTVTVPGTAVTGPIRVTTSGIITTSVQTFTVVHTLTVTVVGNGTVNSSPEGIACAGTPATGCTANFQRGQAVSLLPFGSSGGVLTGWSGGCTGTGGCSVTMNADTAVTATFSSGANNIRIGSVSYPSLQAAFDAVTPGSIIRMQAGQYPVTSVIYHINADAELAGGYDSAFTTNTNNFSTLLGPMFIQNGTLRVEGLKIR